MRIAVAVLPILLCPVLCLAQDQKQDKLREARAAAVAIVRPSGPVRLVTLEQHTPAEWRTAPRIVGTYSNYTDRHRYTPATFFWCYPYGYGCYRGYFGGGYTGGGVGIWGFSGW